ncbi:energy transducer TonB [Rhodanobacter sp. DHG33]|uniref:energy transducer TonB n=1 Tax=Rhodanobacter sp. DHG33 TaxID=2775921 RepID=UPI00177F0360|nr:energy transducer TonB [Rhodanobacter sp. DHG33]MBD8899027.1 energy transducer TonB [Rhodanobacter sp. DHG33]
MKKVMLSALLAMAAMGTQAATKPAVESSAVVNGTIVLAKDGTVQTAVVDDPAKYGQPIADMVRNAALQWHFQPVLQDGQPVVAKASMHARVVLTQKPDGNYSARIKGVTFGDPDPNDTSTLRADKKIIPHYPQDAIRARVQGTVYVALHVDRSGHVTQAVAEQVNLGVQGQEGVLAHYREVLAHSALSTIQKWTFLPPTTGKLSKDDSWTVHVPVTYNLNVVGAPKSNHVWQTYVPGPYTPAPWVDRPDVDAADALADDGLRTDGAGPTLLNHG